MSELEAMGHVLVGKSKMHQQVKQEEQQKVYGYSVLERT
jgi:hypothetical protein